MSNCKQFTDFLSRKSEHLGPEIIRDLSPIDTWIGHVPVGKFPAFSGVSHTFDRFNRVYPQIAGCWTDVTDQGCVATPCDPNERKIGIGYTRTSYKLQQASFSTDLLCFDLIVTADYAKEQFRHIIENLRWATNIINSHRLRTEALNIAGQKWACGGSESPLTAITTTWNADCTRLTVTELPTSKLTARHLQRRVHPQILKGALGENLRMNVPPMLELVTDMEVLWNLVEGNSALADRWRFTEFANAGEYFKYGWTGQVGNYAVRADTMPLRFNIVNSTTLELVPPYKNVAATAGIKGVDNDDYYAAPVQADFIWHQKAMTVLVRDVEPIHPLMPFAVRDFGGKWQFVMDNLTCGVDANGNPIAVDNSRRNKGKFIADFAYATKPEYPEFCELFLSLREQACAIDVPRCEADPGYPEQEYYSANDPCEEE